jgi:hypothetical protein
VLASPKGPGLHDSRGREAVRRCEANTDCETSGEGNPLRRVAHLLLAGTVAAGAVVVFGLPAQAQTGSGDLTAFCAARIEANGAQTKAENLAVLAKLVAAAPAVVSAPTSDLQALYKKVGDKAFESKSGTALITQIDGYVYDNCPGRQLPVTAIDYEFQGIPSSLPAGVTKVKLTNNAPKEQHMLAIFKLTPAGESMNLDKILSLPEKKAARFMDERDGAFMEAAPGASGYSPINLTPGTYAYACFFPQGGKKNGTPHYKLGMEGTFTVS